MAKSILELIIKLSREGDADRQTVKELVNVNKGWKDLLAIGGAVTGAYYAIDKVLQFTVGQFVTLTSEIEKFRNQTGMSAEDSSRLLEVMKDLEISAGDVETAFKFAEKNGFQPTLSALEAMQAQYLALNPGMERTQFLLKEFGKSGVNIQKFFETGDIAQRLDAVNKAMIVSDESIQSVQEYKDTVDQLGDAWQGLKLGAGKLILPIVLDIIYGAAGLTRGEEMKKGLEEVNAKLLQNTKSFDEYYAAAKKFYTDPEVVTAAAVLQVNLLDIGIATTEAEYKTAKFAVTMKQSEDSLMAARNAAFSFVSAIDQVSISAEQLKEWQTVITDRTSWELLYTNAKDAADRTQMSFDLLGKGLQDLGYEGSMVWMQYLANTGKLAPAAIAEFIKIEVEIQTAKDMIAAGADFPIVARWIGFGGPGLTPAQIALSGQVQNVGQGGNSGGASAGWKKVGTVNGPGTPDVWYNAATETYNTGGPGHALGGIFDEGAARVGERGEEWLVRNNAGGVSVIPNDMVRRMEAWGITPGEGFGGGGYVGYGPPPPTVQFSGPGGEISTRLSVIHPGAWAEANINNPDPGMREAARNIAKGFAPPPSGGISSPSSSESGSASAMDAVSPVVTETVRSFQATNQQNTQQVQRQTMAVQQSGSLQIAKLDQIRRAVENLAEQLAAEIQKRGR